jgi:uncharacterized glyoxalase superfamily protein PhnB
MTLARAVKVQLVTAHVDETPGMGELSALERCRALGGTPVTLHRYVDDCDAAIEQAAKAGATVKMPAADMFWGDRYGVIVDPFGHSWSIATHLRDLSPEEMAKGMQEMFAQA